MLCDANLETNPIEVDEIRRGIERHEFVLHYQPQVDLETGECRQVEALVRWDHPVHGLLPPDRFIGLAESSDAIGDLTQLIFVEACRQVKVWRESGLTVSVAINISPYTLAEPLALNRIIDYLQVAGVQPEWIELEVTETAVMADPTVVIETLRDLRTYGVRVAVDDFGTGFCSLNYLSMFSIDTVKIDQMFVRDLDENDRHAIITRAVIGLGSSLQQAVVAEGVETRAAWDVLRGLDCDIAQGFFICRPLPAADVTAWLWQQPGSRNPASSQDHGPRPVILIVDDDPMFRKLSRIQLNSARYDVHLATDALEACALLQHLTPALVITDLNLPGMSGFEFTGYIKRSFRLRDTTIIALTAWPESDTEQRARDAGCDWYAVKSPGATSIVDLVSTFAAA